MHIDDAFKDEGDVIVLLGAEAGWMDGSEYQKVAYGKVEGRVPDVDLQLEVELQRKLRAAIEARLLKSAHDCAEGGLAVALAECCIAGGSTGGAQFADPEAPRSGRRRPLARRRRRPRLRRARSPAPRGGPTSPSSARRRRASSSPSRPSCSARWTSVLGELPHRVARPGDRYAI